MIRIKTGFKTASFVFLEYFMVHVAVGCFYK
jgi:hypothetical protein